MKMGGCQHQCSGVLGGLLLFLLLSMVMGAPEAGWSSGLPRGQQITNFQTQQSGLLPFPEGRGPDGTLYKTDYRCEGENMTVSCVDSDGPGLHGTIQVVRGNFGRFSIAICNRHGQTDWSVNCMAPQTTKVLQQKCDGSEECVVPVNSQLFHDACPGTHKYLEIHYACLVSNNHQRPSSSKKARIPVPVFPTWNTNKNEKMNTVNSNKMEVESSPEDAAVGNNNRRKPILVTEKVELERRVPITTPRPTTSSTTISTTTTASTSTASSTTTSTRSPVNKSQKVLQTTSAASIASASASNVVRNADQDLVRPINTPSSSSMNIEPEVLVTPMTGAPACQPVTARQLQWNWTPAGQVALQPCPIGATGLARWYCADEADGPQWQGPSPDMSDCKSVAMTTLEGQVRQEDPENVLVSSLAYLTRTKSLYGGDLEAVVAIMRTVASRIQYRLQSSANFHDKINHIRQVLLNVLRSAANVLEDGPNRLAWLDLSPDRQMKVATSLMLALEENAFLLAGVTETPQEILETYETLTMTIKVARVFSAASTEEVVEFPAKPLLYVDDKISLAASDLEDNSQGGLGEAVFFSYRGLHEILSGAKTHLSFEDDVSSSKKRDWRLNSRIISASLGRGRHIELQKPVTIQLRHLDHVKDSDVVLQDPVCVFWDYEVHGWSDSGCRLIQSNQTYSVCQCDHLTNFALLMRPITPLTNLRLDYVGYIIAAVLFVVLLVGLFKMRSRVKSWCQGVPRRCLASVCCCCCPPTSLDKERRANTSHLEKCQSFYTGLSQGGPAGPGSGAPYPLTAKKSRTLGGTNGLLTSGLGAGNAHTTSRVPNSGSFIQENSNGLRTLNSTPLMMMTKPRPHITLNPYSTQLVDNLNMMMPGNSNNNSTSNSSASTNSTCLGTPLTQSQLMSPQLMNLTNTLRRGPTPQASMSEAVPTNGEVIYRSVSPHGHVYWEIDPHQVYGTNNNQFLNEESVALLSQPQSQPQVSRPYLTSRHGQLTEEDLLLQQHLLAGDPSQVTNGLHDSLHGLQHTNEHTFQPGMVMMASSSNTVTRNNPTTSFVRTGANRFTRKQQSQPQQAQPQQPQVATVSAVTSQANSVPEQLQTQVQIRDILPIQVSVKSSEYIEAKIRTLRRSNNPGASAE